MRKFPTKPRPKQEEEREPECEHEWKKFKQTLEVQERTYEQVKSNMDFKGLGAHFIVKACTKCKQKLYLDYKVER